MLRFNTRHKALLFIAITIALCSTKADADISILQKLRFGEWIITNNNAIHSITVSPSGAFSHSSALIRLNDPQEGVYEIDGLTPNAIITVTATQISPLAAGGNTFNMNTFQVNHTNSNASGVATIRLGATAQTTGSGLAYDSRTYNGSIRIQISY